MWISIILHLISFMAPKNMIVILIIIPKLKGVRSLNTKNLLKFVVLFQYIPGVLRVYPLYREVTRTSGILTETAWAGAAFNLFLYMLASHPVEESEKITKIIVEALEITKQRGIINKGWGGLGNLAEEKDFVYLLDNCPHDWLFLQCAAVVHHGGAGTTAAGLKAACPTTIIPFFGDQPFWGERVHARGVGPPPIPVDEFSLDKLVEAIKFMLDPEVKERAVELAKAMETEDGVTGAVKAFFKHLPSKKLDTNTEPTPSNFFSIRRCFGCS